MIKYRLLCSLILCVFLTGCLGWRSEKPPVHMNPNLDFQPSIKAQELPEPIPDHVVPWGYGGSSATNSDREGIIKSVDPMLYLGKNKDGSWTKKIPVPVNHALLSKGQERYNIYCSMCHGKDESGNGIIMEHGWYKSAAYWDDRIVAYSDGELFDIISHGVRSMPGYAQQIKENDRWAIVAYIRALQLSHRMPYDQLTETLKLKLK